MQNLDFGPTHKTGGAKHRINDFCFLKFFFLEERDRAWQMTCAFGLKPYFDNNEDPWKKMAL